MARFIGNQLNTIAVKEVRTKRGTHFSVNYYLRGIKRDMDAFNEILCKKLPKNVSCIVFEFMDPEGYAEGTKTNPEKYMQLERPEHFKNIDGIQLGSDPAGGKPNNAFTPAQLEISASFSDINDAEDFIPVLRTAINETLKDIKQRAL